MRSCGMGCSRSSFLGRGVQSKRKQIHTKVLGPACAESAKHAIASSILIYQVRFAEAAGPRSRWIRAAGVSAAVVQWDDQACVSAGGSAGSIVQRKCAYFSCGKRIRGSDVRSSAEIRILRARVRVFQLTGARSNQRNAYFS